MYAAAFICVACVSQHTTRPQAMGLNVNMSLLEKRRMLIAAPDDSDESDDDSDFWEEEEGLVSCCLLCIRHSAEGLGIGGWGRMGGGETEPPKGMEKFEQCRAVPYDFVVEVVVPKVAVV